MTAKTKSGRNSSDPVSEGIARGLEQFQNGDYLTRDEARAAREKARGMPLVDVMAEFGITEANLDAISDVELE